MTRPQTRCDLPAVSGRPSLLSTDLPLDLPADLPQEYDYALGGELGTAADDDDEDDDDDEEEDEEEGEDEDDDDDDEPGGASLAADAQADAAMVDEVPGVATAGAAPRGDSLTHELKRHCAGQAAVGGGGGGGGGASAATVPSGPLLGEVKVRAAAEGGGDACDMETEETEDGCNPYARGF